MASKLSLPPWLNASQRALLVTCVIAGIAAAAGALISPALFFQAYLFAFIFWVGMALGCFALTMLHQLSGGMWGAIVLRFLEAGTGTLPAMLVLFVPIAAGVYYLYPWANSATVAQDPTLQHQYPYQNVPLFLIRALVYFIVWITLARLLRRWSLARDVEGGRDLTPRLQRASALGIVVLGLTATFAMIDWVMSLEPHWYSTIYGAMVIMGAVLAAFAFVIFIVALFDMRAPLSQVTGPGLFNDLGSLLLAFVMLWAYLAFSQFLLIYSANLEQEVPWYAKRLEGGWEWVALTVALCNFVLPFVLLLFRDLKRNARLLALVAGFLVLARVVDVFWLVQPAFSPGQLSISWLHVVAWIAIGALWLVVFARRLKQHPLLPAHDRHLIQEAEAEFAHEQK